MNNPEYVKVEDTLYKINTDFKIALKCDEVYRSDVREEEKILAIIYLLFGDKGLENSNHYEQLMEKATRYLLCDKEPNTEEQEIDMDYEQDKSYIKASFYTDYNIPDIYKTEMHWWDFNALMNGLTEKCVLNRIRYVRNYDISDIKDQKTLKEWKKQKEAVALKKKEREITQEEADSYDNFMKQISYRKEE